MTKTEKREFFDACENGRLDVVTGMLEIYPEALDLQNRQGWTPLALATQWAQVEVIEYLIERGADMSLADNSGATPRVLAERLNYESIIDIFRAASRQLERQEIETAKVAALEQFSSGLEAPLKIMRAPLRLRKQG